MATENKEAAQKEQPQKEDAQKPTKDALKKNKNTVKKDSVTATEGTAKSATTTATPAPVKRKKLRKNVLNALVHIKSTFNNTMVTLTDERGEVLAWCSAGKLGFKGARKSTPFAAQVVADEVMNAVQDMGIKRLGVLVNGPGPGRETALRSVAKRGIRVVHIQDVTPVPHNGCRPPKRRRV